MGVERIRSNEPQAWIYWDVRAVDDSGDEDIIVEEHDRVTVTMDSEACTRRSARSCSPSARSREREHQAIGDVPPVRRFELMQHQVAEVVDPRIEPHDHPSPTGHTVDRRVDRAGRISVLKHRYHVGRHLAGERVVVESVDGLLQVTHAGVLVATHARRHVPEDDARMDPSAKASRPARPRV